MKAGRSGKVLTLSQLKEWLFYDPLTGYFTWRVRRGRGTAIGRVAGSLDRQGYVVIRLDGVNYAGHRLAWFYTHGRWPTRDVDHRKMIKGDNRLNQLRPASRSQNMANTGPHRDNASGVKGVWFDKRRAKWATVITKDGHRIWLGYFTNIAAAKRAYTKAAKFYFGDYWRIR